MSLNQFLKVQGHKTLFLVEWKPLVDLGYFSYLSYMKIYEKIISMTKITQWIYYLNDNSFIQLPFIDQHKWGLEMCPKLLEHPVESTIT